MSDTPTTVESSEVVDVSTPVVETPSYAGTKHKVKIDDQELEIPYEQLVADWP